MPDTHLDKGQEVDWLGSGFIASLIVVSVVCLSALVLWEWQHRIRLIDVRLEQKPMNGDGEAEQFYRALPTPALVGVEACGDSQWFIDLLKWLRHQVWVGDAAEVRANCVRKQKTDRFDAGHILRVLMEGPFPRLWVPLQA